MSKVLNAQDFLEATFETNEEVANAVFENYLNSGHHLSVVIDDESGANAKASLSGIKELISSQLLHRLFWRELCLRNDFNIVRRNAFRTDDVFISHPILGAEFENTDAEESHQIGGVFTFNNQKWLIGNEVLTAEMAAHELGSYEESMIAIAENSDFQYLGQALIALTFTLPNLPKKYGFRLTETAEEWMISEALEYAELDSFDVTAQINQNFQERLSWSTLPISKKVKIIEFLEIGLNETDSKLQKDSIHFLGCAALHESTPDIILDKLSGLNNTIVNAVLRFRQDTPLAECDSCGSKIGYGLCLECDGKWLESSSNLSEDEADGIYLHGLDLARNGRRFEAIEIWLPLARQGDVISIDAIIVALWLLGKKQDAKSWLMKLSKLDPQQFDELIARLEIPQSVAKKYKSN